MPGSWHADTADSAPGPEVVVGSVCGRSTTIAGGRRTSSHRWGLAALLVLFGIHGRAAAQCPVGATAEGEAALHLRLKPGESRRSLVKTDQTMSQTLMGQRQDTHQQMSQTIRYDVQDPGEDGRTRIRVTYESISVDMSTPMAHFRWDSSDTTAAVPQGAEVFAAIVGRGYTISMAPDGSDRRAEGWDTLMNSMLDAMKMPPGVMADQMRSLLKSTLDDRVMGEALMQAVATLPEKPGAVGQSWTCTADVARPFPVKRTATYTMRGSEGGMSTLDVTGEMVSDSTVTTSVGPMSMRYAMKGDSKGTLAIEEATGWIVRSRTDLEMTGTAKVEGSPMGPMEMPMTMKTVVTTEPLEGG